MVPNPNPNSSLIHKYKLVWIIGEYGGLFGTLIGCYFCIKNDNYLYVGLGALLGMILGDLVGVISYKIYPILSTKWFESLARVQSAVDGLLIMIGTVFSLQGFYLFYVTHDLVMLGSALFFGIGSIIIWKGRKSDKNMEIHEQKRDKNEEHF